MGLRTLACSVCAAVLQEGVAGAHLWFCLQHWHLGPRSFGTIFLPGSFGRLLLGILSASLPLSASLQIYNEPPLKYCSLSLHARSAIASCMSPCWHLLESLICMYGLSMTLTWPQV